MSFLTKNSKPKKSKISTASSFWADEWSIYDDSLYTDTVFDSSTGKFKTQLASAEKMSTIELLKLSAHRRAIGNFVKILTNKNIRVKFHTKGGDSYTDGNTVTLSADVKPEKFDVAVGLALHEASHINLTDFKLFTRYSVPLHIIEAFETKGWRESTAWVLIKELTNWVEDRRIDNFVYKTCPGYREYYRALYDEYFNANIIDKGLKSSEYTSETIDSYKFRIINLTNPNTNLSKLKGLKKIYDVVNLPNIGRITSTEVSLGIAEDIALIIAQSIDPVGANASNVPQNSNGFDESEEGAGFDLPNDGDNDDDRSNSSENNSDGNETNDSTDSESNGSSNDGDDDDSMGGVPMNAPNGAGDPTNDDTDSKAAGKPADESLSDKLKSALDRQIGKQRDFINDSIKKKAISKKDEKSIDSAEKSGTELKPVGGDLIDGTYRIKNTQCVVSKRLDEELMKDLNFPFASWSTYQKKFTSYNENTLIKGLQLGTLLGKRLAIRSEERVTENPRQKSGKIDKRLIAGLGYDYVNVFQTKDIDKFKKANLHISLDASGSMDGSKWDRTMVTTIAICKAASMINNLSVQVTIRGTWGYNPYICMAYDSRVDKFDKVKRLFPSLKAGGTTPEGLTYQAIMDQFISKTNSVDSYFLNICDGEPYFDSPGFSYNGWAAVEHTRKMVQTIRNKGVKIMGYFVSDSGSRAYSSKENFKRMYGDESQFIDINNITEISKTLNQLFLTK